MRRFVGNVAGAVATVVVVASVLLFLMFPLEVLALGSFVAMLVVVIIVFVNVRERVQEAWDRRHW